jgi:tetratricopeptide (TPR) repeat protein
MFFVKKFLLLALFFTTFALSSSVDYRAQFLGAYYSGNYEAAHALLSKAFTEPTTEAIWEDRIHYYHDFQQCPLHKTDSEAAQALAYLRIGDFAKATLEFGKDWLSLVGLATYKSWENNLEAAQKAAKEALALAPDRGETVFLAGNLADSDEEAISFFDRYLGMPQEDELKKETAKDALGFLKKTRGIKLNQASLAAEPKRFETRFDQGHLVIRGRINDKQDVKLLVDTGASGLSLVDRDWNPKVVSDLAMVGLGKEQISRGKIVVFDQLTVGNFVLQNAVAAVSPSFHSVGFDGVTGTIVFSDYDVLAPLKEGKDFTLLAPSNDPVAGLEAHGLHFASKTTLPFYLVNKMIILKGAIRNSDDQLDFLLDTGAQQSLLAEATARRLMNVNFISSLHVRGGSQLIGLGGALGPQFSADNVDIRIGSLRNNYKKVPVVNLSQISEALELEIDMILGEDFLAGYTLLIDYPHNKITFLK